MLDKVYYKSDKEVILIFTNRPPLILSSDVGVLGLLNEFLAPLSSECTTLSEYAYRVKISKEETQIINLEDVA